MDADAALRRVPMFAELGQDELRLLCERSAEERLTAGDVLFREGDEGDAAFVITAGALEIVKEGQDRDVVLAVRRAGEVIGEMALLQDEPRMATARARDEVTLVRIPRPAITELVETSPAAVRALFDMVLERLRETQAQLRQHERMAQLGTLTAGVAHELNNPAAGARRAATQLRDAVAAHAAATAAAADHLDEAVVGLVDELAERSAASEPLGALAQTDLEDALEDALADAGVAEPWSVAADLVAAGLGPGDLVRVRHATGDEGLGPVLAVVATGRAVEDLVHAVEEGTDRLSSIVRALRSYSFLDQAPVQDVDVTEGIEDTLVLLGAKLRGVRVERRYDPALPRIEAHGSELNQVWTNLLDNAADAIAERRASEGDEAAGTVTIAAEPTEHGIAVEVTDDGPGIPADALPRVFDSFFTTKEPGKGTGLGLDISYRIVVSGHGGDLRVESTPGSTTFRVDLPRRLGPGAAGGGRG